MFEHAILLFLVLIIYAASPYAIMLLADATPARQEPEPRSVPKDLAEPVSRLVAGGRMSDAEAMAILERSADTCNKTRQADILARSIARAEQRRLASRHKREATIILEALYPNTLRR